MKSHCRIGTLSSVNLGTTAHCANQHGCLIKYSYRYFSSCAIQHVASRNLCVLGTICSINIFQNAAWHLRICSFLIRLAPKTQNCKPCVVYCRPVQGVFIRSSVVNGLQGAQCEHFCHLFCLACHNAVPAGTASTHEPGAVQGCPALHSPKVGSCLWTPMIHLFS